MEKKQKHFGTRRPFKISGMQRARKPIGDLGTARRRSTKGTEFIPYNQQQPPVKRELSEREKQFYNFSMETGPSKTPQEMSKSLDNIWGTPGFTEKHGTSGAYFVDEEGNPIKEEVRKIAILQTLKSEPPVQANVIKPYSQWIPKQLLEAAEQVKAQPKILPYYTRDINATGFAPPENLALLPEYQPSIRQYGPKLMKQRVVAAVQPYITQGKRYYQGFQQFGRFARKAEGYGRLVKQRLFTREPSARPSAHTTNIARMIFAPELRQVVHKGETGYKRPVGRPRGLYKNPANVPAQQWYKIQRNMRRQAALRAQQYAMQMMMRRTPPQPPMQYRQPVQYRQMRMPPQPYPQQPQQIPQPPSIWNRRGYITTDWGLFGRRVVVRGTPQSMWN